MKKRFTLFLACVWLLTSAWSFAEPMVGGWVPSADPAITEEIQETFDKALDGLVGVDYVPVAFLGYQVVAGRNLCVLCQATVVYPNAQPYYVLMYLYEDLEDHVEIQKIVDLDVAALLSGASETGEE